MLACHRRVCNSSFQLTPRPVQQQRALSTCPLLISVHHGACCALFVVEFECDLADRDSMSTAPTAAHTNPGLVQDPGQAGPCPARPRPHRLARQRDAGPRGGAPSLPNLLYADASTVHGRSEARTRILSPWAYTRSRTIIRNVKGCIKEGDILALLESEREARCVRTTSPASSRGQSVAMMRRSAVDVVPSRRPMLDLFRVASF